MTDRLPQSACAASRSVFLSTITDSPIFTGRARFTRATSRREQFYPSDTARPGFGLRGPQCDGPGHRADAVRVRQTTSCQDPDRPGLPCGRARQKTSGSCCQSDRWSARGFRTDRYNVLDELARQTDAKAQTTQLSHDALGRLVQAPDLSSNDGFSIDRVGACPRNDVDRDRGMRFHARSTPQR